jgi:polar amino acid transport system permease protein
MPFLIVLYLIGFGIPALGLTDQIIPVELLGGVALVLTYSSYVAEVLRAGIEAVHPSQRLAARSLGLSHYSSLRLVVLPQAVRKVTPALMNDFVSMQKDVGLISVLGAVDAVRQAQIQVASTYNYTAYIVAGLMFVAFSWPFIRFTDWLTARQQAREQIGGLV